MTSLDFIKQLSAGDASQAKDTLNTLISTTAFDVLDGKKKDIASTLYNSVEEDVEQIDELDRYGLAKRKQDIQNYSGKNAAKVPSVYRNDEAPKNILDKIKKGMKIK